jgi:acetoin utilization deacetylase AcuC-like enzyme
MAALVAGACREQGIPFAGVLEGGYDLDALARSTCEVLDVWQRGLTAAPESIAVHGLALRAQERLAKGGVWPTLGQSAA